MDYKSCAEKLYALGRFGIKPGLERINSLLEKLDNPHKGLDIVHVAGTNGKGSVCAMLEALFIAAGLETGLYTSPHLISMRERIRICGEMIEPQDVTDFTARLDALCSEDEDHYTFFEALTCMAFFYFKIHQVQAAILETGMGGRFDATSAATPKVCVITSIGLDHTEYLGTTIDQIAFEKAGIIKEGSTVVCAKQAPLAMAVIERVCDERQAVLIKTEGLLKDVWADKGTFFADIGTLDGQTIKQLALPPGGTYQAENAVLALTAADLFLRQTGQSINASNIRSALKKCLWPARGQEFKTTRGKKLLFIDGAHNEQAAEHLLNTLRIKYPDKKIGFVVSMCGEKKRESFVETIQQPATHITFTTTPNKRTESTNELFDYFKNSISCSFEPDTEKAIDTALGMDIDVVCVTGSLFLAGSCLALIAEEKIKGVFSKNNAPMQQLIQNAVKDCTE